MKILLIAYYYPPIHSGGTERPHKMAAYLPQFGHDVSVLTHCYTGTDLTNPALLRIHDVSHNMHRIGIFRGIWLGYRLLVEGLTRAGRYSSIYSMWKRAVLNASERVMALAQPEAILATYPPVETLEIGLALAERYHLPLIADFRDGLLFEPIERKRIDQYPCIRDKYAQIERDAVANAAGIITVSPPITDYFSTTYPGNQVFTIFNGFDEQDDASRYATQIDLEPEKFNIVHTGRFGGSYVGRNIAPFLNALRSLLADHPELREKLAIHLIGQLGDAELRLMQDLLQQRIIRYHGVCERRVVLAYQAQADLLLLLTAVNRRSMITAKLMEYLRTSRPILALTFQTYAEVLVRTTGSGWVVHPEEEAQIAQTLSRIIYDPGFSQSLSPSTEKIAAFSWTNQMRRLGAILATSL
ncbi:glycosyltransferase [candidate division KSB3 bacterium]|uniref:Glycosyltransferase n=1 Tax=candidate division KSB3 bacterium TaxID=2044937 RepID=A0A9D5JZ17_9BACT|nr:glycosyltransferase [candidate division KSB3 bacterium]MBD3326843.1 glycosyltransferase [candidate division KSB3 bacterium]